MKISFVLFLCLILVKMIVSQPQGRVIMIGLDGFDFELTKTWMENGSLPHLQTLAEQGCFGQLATSNPAQSPVAWATMATGTNPGQHGIYDFLKRGKDSYQPQLGITEVKAWTITGWFARVIFGVILILIYILFFLSFADTFSVLPYKRSWQFIIVVVATTIGFLSLEYNLPWSIPYPHSLKQGKSVWTIAGENQIKTIVLDAPIAFPAEKVDGGELLCGFGVPDLAGTNGIWFHYSTVYQNKTPTETGGFLMPLAGSNPNWKSEVSGPRDLLIAQSYEKYKQKLAVAIDTEKEEILPKMEALNTTMYMSVPLYVKQLPDQKLKITLNTTSVEVANGEWSPWITIEFKMTKLIKISGIARIRVLQTDPPEFYMTPIQFNPLDVPFNIDISEPDSFAKELAEKHGQYATLGWPEATNAIKDGKISEQVFWEDMKNTFEMRRTIFYEQLAREDWQLLMAFFYAPDRAGHIYWRFLNPQHPDTQNPELQTYRDCLLKTYQMCDDLVGHTMEQLKPNDFLLVISDHGFAPFQFEVNLNSWLLQNGYLKLKENSSDRRLQINDLYNNRDSLCQQIDWAQTKAYSIGLGSIYLNIRSREPQGIVEPGEPAEALAKEIAEKLEQLQHDGQQVIHQVYIGKKIYQGSCQNEAPDLIVGFCKNYRVSWQCTLGAISPNIVEPNRLIWSGDHCSIASELIPGVIFSNHSLTLSQTHLMDIAPTILQHFDVSIPSQIEGKAIQHAK